MLPYAVKLQSLTQICKIHIRHTLYYTPTHCPVAPVSANVEKVGRGKGACLSQASTETPKGKQNNGTLWGRGNST